MVRKRDLDRQGFYKKDGMEILAKSKDIIPIKTPQQIIDQYPYIGAFLSSAQGNEVAIKLMLEYHEQF